MFAERMELLILLLINKIDPILTNHYGDLSQDSQIDGPWRYSLDSYREEKVGSSTYIRDRKVNLMEEVWK